MAEEPVYPGETSSQIFAAACDGAACDGDALPPPTTEEKLQSWAIFLFNGDHYSITYLSSLQADRTVGCTCEVCMVCS